MLLTFYNQSNLITVILYFDSFYPYMYHDPLCLFLYLNKTFRMTKFGEFWTQQTFPSCQPWIRMATKGMYNHLLRIWCLCFRSTLGLPIRAKNFKTRIINRIRGSIDLSTKIPWLCYIQTDSYKEILTDLKNI